MLNESFSSALISDNFLPSPALREIFKIIQLPAAGDIFTFSTLAQQHLLRPAGLWRWEVGASPYEDKASQLMPLLEKMGLRGPQQPIQQKYQTIFIHGTIFFNLRPRLKFLDALWEQGLRADDIILVAGQRPLNPEVETGTALFDQAHCPYPFAPGWQPPAHMPANQTEVGRLVWDQIILNRYLREQKLTVLTVPDPLDASTGQKRHANTGDTIWHWLKSSTSVRSCLAISNNPFIGYQDAVLREVMAEQKIMVPSPACETAGAAANADVGLSIYLDSLARWLYSEVKFLKAIQLPRQ
ncbi:hypothetical protein [Candidatus Odyssella thessalonicensis]|uniref:hypothetical protein n=1 Tax=Candidatus Odyssella thessalonicensis TaxID=84647 RepID=UPI000225BAED|nr:hypothetical protein [Candidatus Odyssella thessalonicensis]